jgi:hypothetical protein
VVVGIVLLFVHLWLGGDTLCIHRHGNCRTIGNEDMSPQEKANELFQSFGVAIAERVDVDGFVCNTEQAKNCALIMVDDIIKRSDKNKIVYSFYEGDCLTQYTEDFYWKKVKHEIDQL